MGINSRDRALPSQFEAWLERTLLIIDRYWSYWSRFTAVGSRLNWSRKMRSFMIKIRLFLPEFQGWRVCKSCRSNLFGGRPLRVDTERYLRMIRVFTIPYARICFCFPRRNITMAVTCGYIIYDVAGNRRHFCLRYTYMGVAATPRRKCNNAQFPKKKGKTKSPAAVSNAESRLVESVCHW